MTEKFEKTNEKGLFSSIHRDRIHIVFVFFLNSYIFEEKRAFMIWNMWNRNIYRFVPFSQPIRIVFFSLFWMRKKKTNKNENDHCSKFEMNQNRRKKRQTKRTRKQLSTERNIHTHTLFSCSFKRNFYYLCKWIVVNCSNQNIDLRIWPKLRITYLFILLLSDDFSAPRFQTCVLVSLDSTHKRFALTLGPMEWLIYFILFVHWISSVKPQKREEP